MLYVILFNLYKVEHHLFSEKSPMGNFYIEIQCIRNHDVSSLGIYQQETQNQYFLEETQIKFFLDLLKIKLIILKYHIFPNLTEIIGQNGLNVIHWLINLDHYQ